ncbi:DDB1- and CUL4-associated factor 11 isoform X2 [Lycorma delicatula]|uniref:DDB1- and CUL4-associated factor 11 isoform X2 n=1 Tax=Lycorma delicatula TaxID=130591 RepID=UPI003F518F6E
MGTSPSHRMEDRDNRSDDSLGSQEQESELTAILRFLIRSGQVHIISSDQDDSDDINVDGDDDDDDDEFVTVTHRPKIDFKPDATKIKSSDISLSTKQASGLIHTISKRRPINLVSLLNSRENGMHGSGSFTRGDKCKISNSHLPNRLQKVDMYCNKAFCGTYSSDGEQFLTACQDRVIRLYHTKGSEYRHFRSILARDVGWSVLDTAFSPDGNYIAYSSWSESLHICRLDDTNEQEALPLCPEDRRFCIFSLVFSYDGDEILGGANDGYLYVYDRNRNQRTLRISGHTDDVNTVAFADNTSQILYSGGDDGVCKVWDRRTLSETSPKPVGVLAGHRDGITFIDSRGDGRHLISNCKDQSIKLWDIRHFSSKDAQESTRKAVCDQKWDYRWQKVPRKLSASNSNIEGDSSIMTYRGHLVLQTLIRCRFSPAFTTGQRYIYTGCASGRIFIYDVLTGEIVKTFKAHEACVRDVAWHPYRSEIVSTSWDYSVMCWNHFGNMTKVVCGEVEMMGSDLDDPDCTDTPWPAVRRSARLAEKRKRRRAERERERNSSSDDAYRPAPH